MAGANRRDLGQVFNKVPELAGNPGWGHPPLADEAE